MKPVTETGGRPCQYREFYIIGRQACYWMQRSKHWLLMLECDNQNVISINWLSDRSLTLDFYLVYPSVRHDFLVFKTVCWPPEPAITDVVMTGEDIIDDVILVWGDS